MKTPLKDIVVILPGIGGSVLQKDGKDLWNVSDLGIDRVLRSLGNGIQDLKLQGDDPNVEDLGDGIRATRLEAGIHLIPGLSKINGYESLLRLISNNFQVIQGDIYNDPDDRTANFYHFPYDWRRDNRANAKILKRLLDQRLKTWQESSGNSNAKVILLAHSMGGLVSRYYLEVLGGWQDCRALFTFGTPYRGSVNAVNFLANGYKKLFLDLTEVMRSLTSVYQLMPIYEMLNIDGQFYRIAESPIELPHIVKERAEAALKFHREIEEAVISNRQEAHYLDSYITVPIIGINQPTLQSAELINGEIIASAKIPAFLENRTDLNHGDGIVPRISAYPLGFGESDILTVSLISEHFASLQNQNAILDNIRYCIELLQNQLYEGIAQIRASCRVRTEGKKEISLSLNDIYPATELVQIKAKVYPSTKFLQVKATIKNTSKECYPLNLDFEKHEQEWILNIDENSLEPGIYKIIVRAENPGTAVSVPVHSCFEVINWQHALDFPFLLFTPDIPQDTNSLKNFLPDLKSNLQSVLKSDSLKQNILSNVLASGSINIGNVHQYILDKVSPSFLRYPYIQCPNSSPINELLTISVKLQIESPAPETEAIEITDTGKLEVLPKILVVLIASSFKIVDPITRKEVSNTKVIQVQRSRDTKVSFFLIPIELGPQKIQFDFYQNETLIGTEEQNIEIIEKEEDGNRKKNKPQPQNRPALDCNPIPVQQEDLRLRIELNKQQQRFTFYLTSTKIDVLNKKIGEVKFEDSFENIIQSFYQELGTLASNSRKLGSSNSDNSQNSSEIINDILEETGNRLWRELIPDTLKQKYWEFKSSVESLLILSDEPWIPWEITKPFQFYEGKTEQEPFWCEQFALSRWLSGPGVANLCSIDSDNLAIPIAPNNTNLSWAQKEATFVKELNKSCVNVNIESIPIISRVKDLKNYLSISQNQFSVLHFACHGMFNTISPDDSAIKLTDRSLRPSSIYLNFGHKSLRPLVFINACHGARIGFSLTQIGGWAKQFVDAKVAVFIGAMWEVDDEIAFEFAQTFYTKLRETDDIAIAEAFQQTRKAIREKYPNNSTWLAYSLYAHPEARIIQQANQKHFR